MGINMIYTNKFGFPDFVQQWLKHDDYDYDKDAISTTTLMQPARAYALKKHHWKELEIDISDLIASRYGTAIHDSVEKVKLTGCKQEERISKRVMNRNITGKYDILRPIAPDQWELIDVKSTSVWTYIYGSKDEDYKKQLSIYRWLSVQNNFNVVQKAKIWMIFTDWSAAKAKNDPAYPQTRIMIKEVDLWGDDETLKYIGERIRLFNRVETMPEEEMPECTDEELWAQEDIYQVMKGDNKRSTKNCKTQAEAEEYIENKAEPLRKSLRVNLRKGGVKRCKYCTARKFCEQYKRLIEQGRSEDHDL